MNERAEIEVSIELPGDLPVTDSDVKLLADLLPQLIKDILPLQAQDED